MSNKFWTMLVAIIMVIVLALAGLTFTVAEGENAVVYTFGGIREGGIKKQAGAYFRLPIGIERVEKVDVRWRTLAIKGNEIVTTRDQNQIYLTLTIVWRVNDVEKYLSRLSNTQGINIAVNAENLLSARVRGARQTIVSGFALSDLVSVQPEQAQKFSAMENALLQHLQNDMRQAACGIEIAQILVTQLALPKDTLKAINERMIAEREMHSEKNITAGKEEAKKIIGLANLEKQNLLSAATAEARRIKGQADAESAEFYREFSQHPDLALFLRRLDALEEILKNKATIVLPVKNPLENLLEEPIMDNPKK